MTDMNSEYAEIISLLKKQIPFEPEICIILGSGLGDFAEKVKTIKSISTGSLPGYPASTVVGHSGFLHFSNYSGKKLLIVQGRIHLYEGYSLKQCILPVYIAKCLNCRNILLTNAAGGMTKNFKPGDLMLATMLNGFNLRGRLNEIPGIATNQEEAYKVRPSKELNDIVNCAAKLEGISLREGVYWYTTGPSYETPAEIKMGINFGGDAVGMSTVHEAIYASLAGLKTASISCISNYAAGLTSKKLSHLEVIETGELIKTSFENLIKRTIELI
ncbi:MAG: purine-nucleoside phosphorylase [Bacteroidota bacterium]|nr:purine-nucleoside phosphorylase [Bacteroidota bacterium]